MRRIPRVIAFGALCCSLAGAIAAAARAAPATAVADSDGALYFPPASGAWETVTPAAAGWDAAALEAAVAFAGERRSSSFLVLLNGRILAERNWELAPDPKDPLDRINRMTSGKTAEGGAIEDVASAQKSVMSFLAGVARGKGLLDFEAPVSRYLGAGWSKATPEQEGAITVRHLLGMATGLEDDGSFEAPAGTKWRYNTPVYSKSVQIVEKASGLTVDQYTRRWLTDRIGMKDSAWKPRDWIDTPEGSGGNTIGFNTSARDLARFGLMILAGGSWQGEDILGDPHYLEEAFASSQSDNPSYGLLWWLNGKDKSPGAGGRIVDGPLIPSAPPDLVAAQGALGRKCYVVPSLGLVVTRTGDEAGRDFNEELWKRLREAAPARR